MNAASVTSLPAMDPEILARLTGKLGDQATISRLCASLGEVFSEFLPDMLESELGFEVAVSYAGFTTGRHGELTEGLGGAMAFCDASLRDWCDHFTLICDSPALFISSAMFWAESRPRLLEDGASRNVYLKPRCMISSAVPSSATCGVLFCSATCVVMRMVELR